MKTFMQWLNEESETYTDYMKELPYMQAGDIVNNFIDGAGEIDAEEATKMYKAAARALDNLRYTSNSLSTTMHKQLMNSLQSAARAFNISL